MKQFLRLLLAAGVLAFAASITAVSCGKAADPNNNNNTTANNNSGNNNSGGGSSGSGGGGGDTPIPPAVLSVENIDTSVAELKDGTNIELKASGFPTTVVDANIGTTTLTSFLGGAPRTSIKRAFDIVITRGVVGGAAATAGLVLVNTGDLDNANAFSLASMGNSLASYSVLERKEGLRNMIPTATDNGNTAIFKAGWGVYSLFMNDASPTTAAEADANATPFSFSATAATHPIMICQMTITTVTDGNTTGTGALLDTTVLTGGQKASCYVGASGAAFTGANATAWLNTAASNTFKKTFNIAAMGIRTDAKTVGSMGLTATDKAAAIRDGITTAEMAELTAANPSAYKKFSITLK